MKINKYWIILIAEIIGVILLALIFLFFFKYKNELESNPCKLCVESYNFTCFNEDYTLYKGYDWSGKSQLNEKNMENYNKIIEDLNKTNEILNELFNISKTKPLNTT